MTTSKTEAARSKASAVGRSEKEVFRSRNRRDFVRVVVAGDGKSWTELLAILELLDDGSPHRTFGGEKLGRKTRRQCRARRRSEKERSRLTSAFPRM